MSDGWVGTIEFIRGEKVIRAPIVSYAGSDEFYESVLAGGEIERSERQIAKTGKWDDLDINPKVVEALRSGFSIHFVDLGLEQRIRKTIIGAGIDWRERWVERIKGRVAPRMADDATNADSVKPERGCE